MTAATRQAPLITVAMSVRDNAATVGMAIRSILAQTCADFEFIIVDDGSRDGTRAQIEQYGDPRLRLITDGATRGLAARLNGIVGQARGTFIARMDGDDFSYPERFERQLAFLAANPAVDLVGTGAIAFGATGTVLGAFDLAADHEAICAHPQAGFGVPHPTWLGRAAWFGRFAYPEAVARGQDQIKLLAAFQTSRFGNISAPLLGYRQDTPKLHHITGSRLPYLRALAGHAIAASDWPLLARGVASQLTRISVGVAAIAMGGGDRLLARRFRAATADELAEFEHVRRTLDTH